MDKIKINKIKKGEFKEIRKKAWKLVSTKNMIPLAIGIIIGGAFSVLVNSLANDVVNQGLAKAFGYKQLKYISSGTTLWERLFVYKEGSADPVSIKGLPLNGIMYGKFLSASISFVIISLFLFSFAFTTYLIMRRFVISKSKLKAKSSDELILEELKSINKKLKK